MLTDNDILLRAAKRNYNIFKTSASFVSAKKTERYYTSENQADLDIKTSVNKIGEIINFSQELNSLLWNKFNQGNKYNDVKELYYDICQLNVMSGIEIDKAKKEFDIDNIKELNKIRNKYKDILTDKDNKKKTPHFFSYISKQKGYYNPNKKNYCKYNTSMDYLHTIVNRFKIKNPYKKEWYPFVSILDRRKFRESNVNYEQINKIQFSIKKYVNDRKNIFISDLDREEKFNKTKILYEDLFNKINEENIGFSTLYRLLLSLEDKENSQIKSILLQILYSEDNKCFKKAIINSVCEIDEILCGGDDLKLYGIGYKIIKNRVNF